MTRRFSGKTILVTGALRRLGLIMTQAFLKEGAHVICHHHTSYKSYDLIERVAKENGVSSWAIQADLSREEGAQKLISEAFAVAPKIDLLVNNASIYNQDTVRDFKAEEMVQSLWIHGISPLLLSRAFEKRAVPGSSIINIVDGAVNKHRHEYLSYELGKKMLLQVTQIMAIEFAPKVRVNALALGTFLPDVHGDDLSYNKIIESMPIPREGTQAELTESLMYLALNSFVTGEALFLDGGWHLKGGQLIY